MLHTSATNWSQVAQSGKSFYAYPDCTLFQDEFAHLGKKAKETMMRNIASESTPNCNEPIIVDRINTLKVHRKDVFGALNTVGVRMVVVWDMAARDCIGRIKSRSFGHKSIKPTDNIAMIVGRTNNELEPLSSDEIDMYKIRKVIHIEDPMSMSREDVVRFILDNLSELFPALKDVSTEAIRSAVSKTILREEKLSTDNAKTLSGSVMVRQSSQSSVKEGRFELSMCEPSKFTSLFEYFNESPTFKLKNEFHVTLLFIGRALAKVLNTEPKEHASHTNPHSINEYLSAISQFKELRDSKLPVKLKYIAKNDRVAAVCVEIMDPSVKYFDVIPHVSLAKVPEAEFRESNFMIEAVEKLRAEGKKGRSDDGRFTWIDVDDSDPTFGKIRFARHGQ